MFEKKIGENVETYMDFAIDTNGENLDENGNKLEDQNVDQCGDIISLMGNETRMN